MTEGRTPSLVDIHSHLVHGVDDGARHLPGVLNAVERLADAGIRRLITTPHIDASLALMPERLAVRLDEVSEAWQTAHDAISREFPEVEYHRGHEVLIDVPEPELTDPRLRLAGTSFVLIEWPRLSVPPGTPRVVRYIRDQGQRPVIAHPERYSGMSRKLELTTQWKEEGALLQVNFGSLVGRYGSEARSVAWRLLETGQADYLATDFHGHSRLKIYKKEAWSEVESRGGSEALDLLCRVNPSRILEDLEPLAVPEVSAPASLLRRLRGIMSARSATSAARA